MYKREISNIIRVAKERVQAELQTATEKSDPLQTDVLERDQTNEGTNELHEERETAGVDNSWRCTTRAGCCPPFLHASMDAIHTAATRVLSHRQGNQGTGWLKWHCDCQAHSLTHPTILLILQTDSIGTQNSLPHIQFLASDFTSKVTKPEVTDNPNRNQMG